ncbi:MAG TPA: cytochrome b N-terminal domain-containing protein [Planctomycetota bacterium]|nr:cytochrome b N-terminal domain-containing protein [Planctomycetota bacterium]
MTHETRRMRRSLFGARSRVYAFLSALGRLRVTPRYRGPRWSSAIILLLFGIELATGILLSLYYYPEPDGAYETLRFLQGTVSGGWLMRSAHAWAGELLLVAVLAHLGCVYFRRAYAHPREYEWVVGGLLLLATLAFRFTGRLLPWDEFGFQSARAGLDLLRSVPVLGPLLSTWLRGGDDMGANTLSRFFTTHVLILPWFVAVATAVHFYLVRRHGLSGAEEGA